MQNNDKTNGEDIVIQSPVLKWLDNFWYHYKWTVIIVAFFVLVFAVCVTQCATTPHKDIYVTFSGGYTLTDDETAAIEQVLGQLSKKTFSENAPAVGFASYSFYTEEELRELYTDPETGDFDNYGFQTAKQYNSSRLSDLGQYMMTGECSIWFVSETVYEHERMKDKIAVRLSDTFQQPPAYAYDEYAVRLGDTALYQTYEALQILPADTLIVFTVSYFMGASSNKETYAQFKELYRAIIEFQAA